ncbi:reticulon-3-A-like isoform X2 [Rhopilema esculentum]
MLTLRAIWVLKCAFMKESLDNPFQPWLDTDVELNGEKISKYNTYFLQFISDWAVFLRKLVLVADMMNTAKALGVLFFMYHLGNNFSGITLLFAGILIAFTVPKIHDMYKDEINKIKSTIFDKYDNFRSRIQAVIPIGKTEKKKE